MMKRTKKQKLCGKPTRTFPTKAIGISVFTALTFQDYLLSAGETAEYYVRIRYKDGRASTNSNIVVVTAPIEKTK